MAIAKQIQYFLQTQIKQHKIKSKFLAQEINLPHATISRLINATRPNPKLITILKIANHFQCLIDQILSRNDYVLSHNQTQKFSDLTLESINDNLRKFIQHKLLIQNINPNTLGTSIGFSQEVIPSFLKDNNAKKILSSSVILALADYFQVSIDEMIGRVKPTTAVNSSDENSDKDIDLNNL